ncbi:hypothetical protein, partial [Mesorhizobium captivum]|uniref:hypothetical protein n=1 Tax=Mesorhizobium captivum TaxID=3072319 RepID=UPI002A248119
DRDFATGCQISLSGFSNLNTSWSQPRFQRDRAAGRKPLCGVDPRFLFEPKLPTTVCLPLKLREDLSYSQAYTWLASRPTIARANMSYWHSHDPMNSRRMTTLSPGEANILFGHRGSTVPQMTARIAAWGRDFIPRLAATSSDHEYDRFIEKEGPKA